MIASNATSLSATKQGALRGSSESGRDTRASDDFKLAPLQTLPWSASIPEDERSIYDWVYAQANDLQAWYLRNKRKRARASKTLRAVAIVAITMSAVMPVVSLLTSEKVQSEWGYVALFVGAGAVLFDRAFGLSSSWIRFMRAASKVGSVLASLEVQRARRIVGEIEAAAFLAELSDLTFKLRTIQETETEEWAAEFDRRTGEFHALFPSPH